VTDEHAAAAVTPTLAHVIVHVRDALATDARVGELGLDVVADRDGLVVRGTINNVARRSCIVAVATEVLRSHGIELDVLDETELSSTAAPTTEPEQL
jgi:hypothetical protein